MDYESKIPASGDSLSTSQGQISGNFTLIEGALGSSTLSSGITKAQGDIFYASDSQFIQKLTKNATVQRSLVNSGATNNPAWGQVSLTAGVVGTLPIANGGTGSTATTYLDLASNAYGVLAQANGGTESTKLISNGSYVGSNLNVSVAHTLGRQPKLVLIQDNGNYDDALIYWIHGMGNLLQDATNSKASTVFSCTTTQLIFQGADSPGMTSSTWYNFIVA